MSRTLHPARRARQIVAVVSGVSYLGMTSSIAVATALASDAEDVDAVIPVAGENDSALALELDGAATTVASTLTTVETTNDAVDLFASTTETSITDESAVSVLDSSSTAPPATSTSPPSSRPAAPTTQPQTIAPPTTAPPSSATTAGPTSSVEQTTSTSVVVTSTTQATTTTTQATTTTSTTQATTTTTTEPS